MNKEKMPAGEREIKQILDDLYKMDKSLKMREEELKGIISKLIKSKPDTDIDDVFVARVREELARASEAAMPETKKNFQFKWSYAFGGVAVAALLLLIVINFADLDAGKKSAVKISAKAGVVKNLENKAFGALGVLRTAGNSQGVPAAERSFDALAGAGGGGTAVQTDEKMISMPAPDCINYNFVYDGEEIAGTDDMLTVYRRVAASQPGAPAAGTVGNLSLVDMGKFENLFVDNLNFAENREYGYNIYYNLRNNEVSVSMNYEKWPDPFRDCRDEKCYEDNRLKIGDVLSENEAVVIADKFLEDYGIDKLSYGPGEADKAWLIAYESSVRTGFAPYVPESMTIIYPIVIEGAEVLDEGGRKVGMRVEVSSRHKRAVNAYGIRFNQFEGSEYEVLNDTEKLIGYAEQGGLTPGYEFPEASKTVDVKLGTPKLSLVNYWRYGNGANEELYVPALVFPIKEKPAEGYFYTENVVIPLVKEIIDERLKEYENNQIMEPTPLMKGVEDGTSANPGSAGQAPEIMVEEPLMQIER